MFDLTHLGLFISIFFVMLMFVHLIPSLFEAYRERYQSNTQRTTRELNRFFLDIKPTKIVIGMVVLGAVLGYLLESWVVLAALAIAGIFMPKVILSIWKDIRSNQF